MSYSPYHYLSPPDVAFYDINDRPQMEAGELIQEHRTGNSISHKQLNFFSSFRALPSHKVDFKSIKMDMYGLYLIQEPDTEEKQEALLFKKMSTRDGSGLQLGDYSENHIDLDTNQEGIRKINVAYETFCLPKEPVRPPVNKKCGECIKQALTIIPKTLIGAITAASYMQDGNRVKMAIPFLRFHETKDSYEPKYPLTTRQLQGAKNLIFRDSLEGNKDMKMTIFKPMDMDTKLGLSEETKERGLMEFPHNLPSA